MKRIILSVLVVASFAVAAQKNVSNETLGKAIYGTTDFFTSIKTLGDGSYQAKFLVYGAHPTDGDKIESYNLAALFKNDGEHFIMAVSLPTIFGPVYDQMKEDGSLDKTFGKYSKKYEAMEYEPGKENNIVLVVKKKYSSKNYIPIIGQVTGTSNVVKKIYGTLAAFQQKIITKKVKGFSGDKVELVENIWLPIYFDYEKLREFEKSPGESGAQGFWSYSNSGIKMDFDLYNFSDRFEIRITRELASGQSHQDFVSDLENFVKRNKYKKATKTEVISIGDNAYSGVCAIFAYNGKTTGKDLIDGFSEYYNYGNRLRKVFE